MIIIRRNIPHKTYVQPKNPPKVRVFSLLFSNSRTRTGLYFFSVFVYCRHDLSKYTVPTSFVGIAVPTKVVGMLVVLAIPTKVVGMQASNQIQESEIPLKN